MLSKRIYICVCVRERNLILFLGNLLAACSRRRPERRPSQFVLCRLRRVLLYVAYQMQREGILWRLLPKGTGGERKKAGKRSCVARNLPCISRNSARNHWKASKSGGRPRLRIQKRRRTRLKMKGGKMGSAMHNQVAL